jgi:4-aminobutyrate aminotransferase-like enzyme
MPASIGALRSTNAPHGCAYPANPTEGLWPASRYAATARGVALIQNFVLALAENAQLRDFDGHRYIDFAGDIDVLNTAS